MGKLTITQKAKGRFVMSRYLLIGGKMVGLMREKKTSIELLPGTYQVRIQSALKWFYSDAMVSVSESSDAFIDYHDRERVWDMLFLVDIVFWCIKGIFHLAHPWSLIYDIFTNGYFALWAVYEVVIRKRYFKLDVYTKPSHAVELTLPLTKDMEEKAELSGHVGTHFDVMDKAFPMGYSLLHGIIFDVSSRGYDEIGIDDIPLSLVGERMFVGFRSGIQERHPYGSMEYRKQHPTLSYELMQELINRRVAVIGLDFAGVRRGPEHTPADQTLADNGAFVIENLCNMESVLDGEEYRQVMISIVPNVKDDATGIPCRVSARTI